MDCDEVKELLDAYALGAADADEAAALEEHMGDCVRCWPSFTEAQQAAASLALSVSLQQAPESLRKGILAEIERASARLTAQQQTIATLAAPDIQQVSLEPTDPTSSAGAAYHWSDATKSGALVCNNLPTLNEGQVYQVWLLSESGSHSAGSFHSRDGIGRLNLDLSAAPERPLAIGVSVESAEGAHQPGEMFLIAEFRE